MKVLQETEVRYNADIDPSKSRVVAFHASFTEQGKTVSE